MTFGKFNHFICIIIIIFVSNSNAEASNSKCLQDWRRMGAQTAVGNYARTDGVEDAHGSVKISLTVEGLGIYDEYWGNYSTTIKLAGDNEDYGFRNNEPIFIQEIGNNCIWKQDTGIWWIGNCDEIEENKGFAFMNNCECPWPSKDDFGSCNKCTWTKYPSKEKLSCNPKKDIECEFGIGFQREDYGNLDWVGNKCYSPLGTEKAHGAGGQNPDHNSPSAKLGQQVKKFRVPTSGQKCKRAGGKLELRLRPPPRIIRCKYPKATTTTTTTNSPANLCLTKSGPSLNQPCIFPFTFRGKTYNGCPIDLNDSSERWCSTKVDSKGKHIGGQGNYGFCSSKCPIEN